MPMMQIISKVQIDPEEKVIKGCTDLDSHADTCCAGATATVIEYTGKSCNVSPISSVYDSIMEAPIVKAATAFDYPISSETLILIMNQALYLGNQLENSLLCPNHIRSHGVVVNDVPIHLSFKDACTHFICFPTEEVRIPLDMYGCISYISMRLPSKDEIANCTWLEMTSAIKWDPYAIEFKQQEDLAREAEEPVSTGNREIYNVLSAVSSVIVEESVLKAITKPSPLIIAATI
jgi:hypothetical protein